MAVIRLLTPLEALHNANATDRMRPMPRVARPWVVRVVTWSVINVRACSGRAEVIEVIWVPMAAGSASSPYKETTATRAGNRARKA